MWRYDSPSLMEPAEWRAEWRHIIDLNAECAKLTMFRGQTPQTTRAERKGSAAQLPRYRDGLLLLGKSAGTGHWETHPEDELVHVLDGAATLDIVQEDGPQSFALGAGMIAVVPPGAWHRFRSVGWQDHDERGRSPVSISISMSTILGRYCRRPH